MKIIDAISTETTKALGGGSLMINREKAGDLAIEAVVIVVSILLAFSLDAWWDARGQRLEEEQILENLQTEFAAAGVQLDQYILYHRVTLSSVSLVLDSTRAAHAEGRTLVEVPSIHLARALIGPTFQPRTGTLEGLEHSGALGILQSGELRQTLLAWPGLLAEASEEEQGSLDFINNQLEPALRGQMDLSPLRLMVQEITEYACGDLFFGRSCEDRSQATVIPPPWAGTTNLPVNFEVLGLFAARYQILAHGIDQLEPVRDEIDRILELTGKSLGR